MHFGTSSMSVAKRETTATDMRKKHQPLRTAQSRRLVEDYWLSVLNSKVERPLYHTYSDRYGGTRGIPFAARTDSSVVLRGTVHDVARATDRESLFAWCMEASEGAMAAGDVSEARACLRQALTQLQNTDGGLTVSALASTARGASASPVGQKRSEDTGNVLRRLGKIALLCDDLEEALTLLDWSAEADPLTAETYVLRAACLERMLEPQRAFVEYEKYLKLTPPTLEVLAHCGKCAAEAGNVAAATRYLEQLLRETESVCAQGDEAARSSAAFYQAHAYFYLGVVLQQQNVGVQEEVGGRGELAESASRYYSAAAANAAYVQSHEKSVDEAVEKGDYALAQYQLGCLQRMVPECADYHLRTAYVCHLQGDIPREIDALSEALDRHQGFSTRRTTLLTRGTVYADKVGDLERAIKDFTLVLGLPADAEMDRCTPIAFMKRAEVLLRRCALGGPDAHEDQEAALADYKQFLSSLRGTAASRYEPVTHGGAVGEGELCETSPSAPPAASAVFDESEICASQSVTDALLILANGAFRKQEYDEATHYFSLALARGWLPRRAKPFPSNEQPAPPHLVGLYDQMYLSMAHHVTTAYPVHEDMFKIPYEPRDWSGAGTAVGSGAGCESGTGGTVGTSTSARKSAGGGGRTADRKDSERVTFASPSLLYSLVDSRYAALRGLEPTVFSALEEALLAVWAPYRSEVDRVREDAIASKAGKRAKRHV